MTTEYTASCDKCDFVTNEYGTQEVADEVLARHKQYCKKK